MDAKVLIFLLNNKKEIKYKEMKLPLIMLWWLFNYFDIRI